MKKIVPFKKDIIFQTDIVEVIGISLEHNLEKKEDSKVCGNFIISGDYKVTENSLSLEKFHYELPFEINLDEKYILKNMEISIDDFYYEIINNKVLSISIEVLMDKLEEKEIEKIEIEEEETIDQKIEEEKKDMEDKNERCIDTEEITEFKSETEEIYKSYKVYIVREGDTLESILEKYGITKSELEDYNDLSTFKINDKIIIPTDNETNS